MGQCVLMDETWISPGINTTHTFLKCPSSWSHHNCSCQFWCTYWPTLIPCISLLTAPHQTVFQEHSLYYQGTTALLHLPKIKPQLLCAPEICCWQLQQKSPTLLALLHWWVHGQAWSHAHPFQITSLLWMNACIQGPNVWIVRREVSSWLFEFRYPHYLFGCCFH